MASSNSGGVTVVTLGGRMARERERLIGMTDEERAYRAKFLKSLELAPEEPIIPKNFNKEYYNPLRRLYMAPLNKFESAITPMVGDCAAYAIRTLLGRSIIGIFVIYGGWYYYRYNTATWMRQSGWRVMRDRETVFPGTPEFPKITGPKKPNEYATFGFEKSPI
ncbi:NADH dehydrogenase (ubiquinone) B17 subunit [Megachile rotundata]|uniref:NADH dehydrogenase (ubiquinone) B17 subunit n=1 Tax=Megachile rotundata TaxID=143995 RepID=UPI000258EF6A|nr:PREDICTED: uncharacterized protein LOC100881550 [Megachile rotundata]